MKELVKPGRLRKGDTVAAISISGGRVGDSDMLWRYQLGKKRLEEVFGLRVIETPNALKGKDFLYRNPKQQIMGTNIYPKKDMWEGSILFIDNFSPMAAHWRRFTHGGPLRLPALLRKRRA